MWSSPTVPHSMQWLVLAVLDVHQSGTKYKQITTYLPLNQGYLLAKTILHHQALFHLRLKETYTKRSPS